MISFETMFLGNERIFITAVLLGWTNVVTCRCCSLLFIRSANELSRTRWQRQVFKCIEMVWALAKDRWSSTDAANYQFVHYLFTWMVHRNPHISIVATFFFTTNSMRKRNRISIVHLINKTNHIHNNLVLFHRILWEWAFLVHHWRDQLYTIN